MIRSLLALLLVLPALAQATIVVETDEEVGSSGAASSQACAAPAGTAAGNLLIGIVSMMDDAGHATKTFDLPSGWTRIVQTNSAASWGTRDSVIALDYRIATGDAAATGTTTWTYDSGSTSGITSCVIMRITGARQDTPFRPVYVDGSHRAVQINAFTSNVYTGGAPAAITTEVANSLVMIFSKFTSSSATATFVPPTGYTLDHSTVLSGSTDKIFAIASKTVAAAGTETPGTPAHTNFADSIDIMDFTIAIQPKRHLTMLRERR